MYGVYARVSCEFRALRESEVVGMDVGVLELGEGIYTSMLL